MSAGMKANLDGSAAIQVGGTDVIGLAVTSAERMSIDASGGTTVGKSMTAQYPAQLTIADTTHVTSKRAALYLGSAWIVGQDLSGNGTRDFFIFDAVANATRTIIDTSGNFWFNSGYGGAAIAYGCRAWVNFAGATGTINASGNVSSITVNGTGDYTVNFTTAMPDINYVPVATPGGVANRNTIVAADYVSARTTSAVRFSVFSQQTGVNVNPGTLNVAVMR